MSKTRELSRELASAVKSSLPFGEVARQIYIALKKQDRITRHACAENVLNFANTDGYDECGVLIQTDKAHDVIMNTKAV